MTIIDVRNRIHEILPATLSIPADSTVLRKVDVAESYPSASVYLGTVASTASAMRGHRERTFSIEVMVWRDSPGTHQDLEAAFIADIDALEEAVETERRAKILPQEISLSQADQNFLPDSKGKSGAILIRFETTINHQLN